MRRLAIALLASVVIASATLAVVGIVDTAQSAGAATYRMFSTSMRPQVAAATDTREVEVGVRFTPLVALKATGITFYKGPGNGGIHSGSIWDASTGKAVARVLFSKETATGWQQAMFASAVTLKVGGKYIVSYHAPDGRYSYTQNYFKQARSNGVIRMPAPTSTLANGVYRYGPGGHMPAIGSGHATNYFVDVIVSTSPNVATTTTTTVTSSSPWPDASNTGVPAGVTLSAYTGPMTITKCGAVIDRKIVTGELTVTVGNGTHSPLTPCVTIEDSLVKGAVHGGYTKQGYGPIVLTDTEIAMPVPNDGASTALDESNFYGWRLDIHNARSGVMCDGYCALHDSYVHDNYYVSPSHMDSFITNGNEGPIVLDHNAFLCRFLNPGASDGNGGCSADLGSFADFNAITNMTVENNLFMGSSDSGYCVYTGANETAKPYPTGKNLVWLNNRWVRGSTGKCGFGGPVYDWQSGSGNRWCNNLYTDGTPVKTGVACT